MVTQHHQCIHLGSKTPPLPIPPDVEHHHKPDGFSWHSYSRRIFGLVYYGCEDQSAIADEVKQAAVLDWVRMHRISWRKGAELLGMPLRDFMGLMSEHKVPAAKFEAGWLDDELATFKDPTSQDES